MKAKKLTAMLLALVMALSLLTVGANQIIICQ